MDTFQTFRLSTGISGSITLALFCLTSAVYADDANWQQVYTESFDRLPAGTQTGSKALPGWERGSASGQIFDGKTKAAGKFLVASSSWTSFNQGPILNLNLSASPHDRVRVRFELYTFGDWRGLQRASGGPQHRLMFFDNKAKPPFSFDTNFATNPGFKQSWPERNPAMNVAGKGAKPVAVDSTGRFGKAHRWPVEFEYASESPSLRFAMLCGAAAGSGQSMPHFGIDNLQILVRSTAPVIAPFDRPDQIRLAAQNKPVNRTAHISFELKQAGKVSLAVFDTKTGQLARELVRGEHFPAGRHTTRWDGFDNRGNAVPTGTYQWRLISSPGFTARYITTIGINPPGGEHAVPRMSWVGDHVGAGIVDVDPSGVYVGSPLTEGMMMVVKADSALSKRIWTRPQFYQSGQLRRIATSGNHLFMLHPNGKLRRLNPDNGHVETEWSVLLDNAAPHDLDAHQNNLIVTWPDTNKVRWLSTANGQTVAESDLAGARCVTALGTGQGTAAIVSAGGTIYTIQPNQPPRKVATLAGDIGAMDYDHNRKELWVVVDRHKVVRLDAAFRVAQIYSEKPREMGPFDPTRFAGVNDVAADLKGGFFIGEPGHPPRRIVHIARDGSLIDQWFGGMSFYVNATFDPDDPTRLYGIAPEGSVNLYHIDYATGRWKIEATYATGRLGDSLFPMSAAFRAIRKNGQLYLYHRAVPAVLRLDPKLRKAVPVAIAGQVLNRGRSFFQYAGSGRDGYPKPWVAAAEHHGFNNLSRAPRLYSWADTDGDGKFDPKEFRFYPDARLGLSFHNPGDFTTSGDYIGTAATNASHALVRVPVSSWEGPARAAPRWDWHRAAHAGTITADSYGYGSPRGVSVGPDDSIAVTYQAGIMIRAHGQYEGGGWPEAAMKGSRILGFDSHLKPMFAVGRQSKDPAEANSGLLYYPMQTTSGPNRSIIVNDQTKQPAQVWTHDGLYVGGFFDHRADDGLADGFYQLHGDDNQGATVVTAADGKTYWLMPYVGHNRLYEIQGWDSWQRQSGNIKRPDPIATRPQTGTGLTARYVKSSKQVLKSVETPIYYEPFGAERHAKTIQPHYKVNWSGFVEPPFGDRYKFRSFVGAGEQLAVWIDGHLVHTAGLSTSVDKQMNLVAGHRHQIRIEYINPDGRAELKLLWSCRVIDPVPLSKERLYPER